MEEKNKKDINRRDFIKIVGISAATSTGLLYGCSSKGTTSSSSATGEGEVPTDKMTYRTSPTTGDRVSLLGYGCIGRSNLLPTVMVKLSTRMLSMD